MIVKRRLLNVELLHLFEMTKTIAKFWRTMVITRAGSRQRVARGRPRVRSAHPTHKYKHQRKTCILSQHEYKDE